MLSETDKELLSYMLDEHDYTWVLSLIDTAYDTGYTDGYLDGFDKGYEAGKSLIVNTI